MADWIVIGSVVGVLIATGAFVSWLLSSMLEEYFGIRQRKQFEEDLARAIVATQPPVEQILQIARTRDVKNPVVYSVLQRQLREVLTGRSTDLAPYRTVIEQYIARMDEAEPYEGIPSQIRIHLERLREHSPESKALIEPLISQVRELLSINEKGRKQQQYYTVGGFFVGIVGILIAIVTYFYPNTGSTSTATTVPPAETATK